MTANEAVEPTATVECRDANAVDALNRPKNVNTLDAGGRAQAFARMALQADQFVSAADLRLAASGGAGSCFDAGMSVPSPGPGRPRDPDVERRALEAARAVYGRRGWSGFTLDEVARASGIGKGSVYLRWSSKAVLLVAAVRDAVPAIGEIDTGDVTSDLVEFGLRWMRFVAGDDGALTWRLSLDRRYYPELAEAVAAEPYPAYVRATRAIVRRGVARGELPPTTSPALVGDLVAGAVANHVRVTPEALLDWSQAQGYVAEVVDTVLRGVRAIPRL